MIGDKSAIFIDTNVFEKNGFNFDERNKILTQYKTLLKEYNYENVIISVVDNEVKKHIKKKIAENEISIKKHCKWIYDIVDKEKIQECLNKDLNDYEKFKTDTSTIYKDISDINPEKIMEKHFNVIYPFELSKMYEFKDAFFLEAIYKYAEEHDTYMSFIVISQDNGIKKAIENQKNKKIICFNSIEEYIDTTINCPHEEKMKIFDYISKYNFNSQIIEKIKINIMDIEEGEIDIEEYCAHGIYFPKIIKNSTNKVIIVCDMNIYLIGKFKCLDYDNSYYSNEEGEYLYKTYKEREYLNFICQTLVEVGIENGKMVSASIVDLPEIDIEYESFMTLDEYMDK